MPVAQKDRASDFESEGCGFNSRRAHFIVTLIFLLNSCSSLHFTPVYFGVISSEPNQVLYQLPTEDVQEKKNFVGFEAEPLVIESEEIEIKLKTFKVYQISKEKKYLRDVLTKQNDLVLYGYHPFASEGKFGDPEIYKDAGKIVLNMFLIYPVQCLFDLVALGLPLWWQGACPTYLVSFLTLPVAVVKSKDLISTQVETWVLESSDLIKEDYSELLYNAPLTLEISLFNQVVSSHIIPFDGKISQDYMSRIISSACISIFSNFYNVGDTENLSNAIFKLNTMFGQEEDQEHNIFQLSLIFPPEISIDGSYYRISNNPRYRVSARYLKRLSVLVKEKLYRSADFYFFQGIVASLQNSRESVKFFLECLKIDQKHPLCNAYIGDFYLSEGNIEKGREFVNRAYEYSQGDTFVVRLKNQFVDLESSIEIVDKLEKILKSRKQKIDGGVVALVMQARNKMENIDKKYIKDLERRLDDIKRIIKKVQEKQNYRDINSYEELVYIGDFILLDKYNVAKFVENPLDYSGKYMCIAGEVMRQPELRNIIIDTWVIDSDGGFVKFPWLNVRIHVGIVNSRFVRLFTGATKNIFCGKLEGVKKVDGTLLPNLKALFVK